MKTTTPDGKVAVTVWNLNHTKQSEIDAAGNRADFAYDGLLRLIKVTQTSGSAAQVTSYTFDSVGNKTSQMDAEGRVTHWEYDPAGRVASRMLPGGQKETFSYDTQGNRTGRTAFNGKPTTTVYDQLGRAVLVSRPDSARIATTYTASGLAASVTVTAEAAAGIQAGATSYSYDAQDRLVRQTNPDGSFLAYAYDGNGNITQRSTMAGTVGYTYDANDHLISVTDYAGKSTAYTYDAAGRLDTIKTPNGIQTTRSYDPNGRLLQILHQKADTSIVSGVRYGLAANGQRLSLDEFDSQSVVNAGVPSGPVRTSAYSYDSAGRLTQEKVSGRDGAILRTTDYAYDRVGNRSRKTETTAAGTQTTTYTYDANDRLLAESRVDVSGTTQNLYSWDDNGNLISRVDGAVTTFYGWSSDNRLIAVTQGASLATAQPIARYTYDASGHLVGKAISNANSAPDSVTRYLVDTSFPYAQTVEETVTTGTATTSTQYVWGASLLQQIRGGQGTFYHADALSSIKLLTDAGGNAQLSYLYDAFGNVEGGGGSASNQYRFTGEYFDDAIGLQFNRARWYDARVGRFVSADSFKGIADRPATLNKYVYANANPVAGRDPSGLTNLIELEEAEEIQAEVDTAGLQAGEDFAAGAGRSVFNKLGDLVENGVKNIVNRCFKGAERNVIQKAGRKVNVDFEVQLGERLIALESKYQIPKRGSAAMARLVEQIQLAAASGKDVVIFSAKKLGPAAKANRERILKELAGATTQPIQIISGFVDLAGWVADAAQFCN